MSGPPLVFTPGPTALHPRVPRELAAAVAEGFASESHRSDRFRSEVQRADEALRALLGVPPDHRILFTGSASEAMERIVEGVVDRRSHHLVNGAFARRFRDVAANLGREVSVREVEGGESFGSGEPVPDDAELLAVTQNETSTGVRIPPDAVHALAGAVRRVGGLAAVDLVTGWPTEPVQAGRIDAGFFSVQKGFGLPAGLGVIVASPALVERARARRSEGRSIGGYLHLAAMADAADRHETVATPNMLAIRLLRVVAEAYLDRGIERIRGETDEKAATVWGALAGRAEVRPFVEDEQARSRTVLVIETAAAASIRDRLLRRGLVVGGGYGPWKGSHLRIANFPVQTPAMTETLVGALVETLDEMREEAAG